MAAAPETGTKFQNIDNHEWPLLLKLNTYLSSTEKAGPLTIYKMKLEHVKDQKIWKFGTEKADKKNKVIMMVGETGSGKTTLINTIINYIFGVKWEDDHRIKLTAENTKKSQAHSQTSSITIYQINPEDGFRIPYSITIIDTPGFGDTRGTNFDEKLMCKIQKFFQKCIFPEIDAICFVVQSTLARLTSTQVYIYDNILSMFGKDIKENIVFFTTFADFQEPIALSAITEAEVPCAQSEDGKPVYFKVNNIMVYANNCSDEEANNYAYNYHKTLWEMGMKSIENFFVHFLPGIVSKDLSKDVPAEKNALDVILYDFLQKYKVLMYKKHELQQTENALNKHKMECEKNERFELELTETRKKK
ncbi:uncharacterized protein [Pyxicephalus adspersus]|uniref:uncharacterized protein n=1 Tax=Pyxicephalus adspersus TaxID=30357 RepID=UPI003B5A7B38